MVIERGTLKQVERKGRDAEIPWLIKFMFIKENGEQLSIGNKNWFGSYSDTAPGGYPHNGQGAFNLKAWEEREIPNPTVWQIEFGDEVSEQVRGGTYQNIYVVSAKTISQSQPQQRSEEPSGGTGSPSPATSNSWVSSLDGTGRSIIRQVAFKEIDNKDGKTPRELLQLTNDYESIILGTYSAESDDEDELEGEEI